MSVRLGSQAKPESHGMNTPQLGSEILSLHWTLFTLRAQLKINSIFSELSRELSQCEMPQYLSIKDTHFITYVDRELNILGNILSYTGTWLLNIVGWSSVQKEAI